MLTLPEKQSGKPGVPVHFTVTGGDGHDLPVPSLLYKLPPGAQFDPSAGTFDWLPQEKDLGLYTITFAATNSLGVVTRKDLTLYVETDRPVIATLENAAARSASEGVCSPGSVAMVTGRFLFGGEGFRSEPAGGRTELDGTRVLVNDVNTAILYASAGRVDFVCPALDPGTVLNIAVVTDAGPSIPMQIKMEETSPGITLRSSAAGRH